MTAPSLITENERLEIILKMRDWLGADGIDHFIEVKKKFGKVDAVWMELGEMDNIIQYVPRSTSTQEGSQVIQLLKTFEICEDWSESDFEEQWVDLVDDAINFDL